jgi:hypothetical protein
VKVHNVDCSITYVGQSRGPEVLSRPGCFRTPETEERSPVPRLPVVPEKRLAGTLLSGTGSDVRENPARGVRVNVSQCGRIFLDCHLIFLKFSSNTLCQTQQQFNVCMYLNSWDLSYTVVGKLANRTRFVSNKHKQIYHYYLSTQANIQVLFEYTNKYSNILEHKQIYPYYLSTQANIQVFLEHKQIFKNMQTNV